jgi:hypothetical protein
MVAKMFEVEVVSGLLGVLDPLLSDSDKFKQLAGAEILTGLLRGKHRYPLLQISFNDHNLSGSKHWPRSLSDKVWAWTALRLDLIFAQIKPDTLTIWEGFFKVLIPEHLVIVILSYRGSRIYLQIGTLDVIKSLLTGFLPYRLSSTGTLHSPVCLNQGYPMRSAEIGIFSEQDPFHI